MWKRAMIMGMLAIGGGCGSVWAGAETQPFHLEIGVETTRISGPLRADGTVNYEEALNALTNCGARDEENAALVIEKLGSDWQERPRQAPGAVVYDFESHRMTAMKAPWRRADYPEVAQWLKANEKVLDGVVLASKLKAFYSEEDGPAWDLSGLRGYGNALCARAMLRLGSRDDAGAREDVAALHRLGVLMGRLPTRTHVWLQGWVEQLAWKTELAAMERASPAEAEKWMDTRMRVQMNDCVAAMDVGYRYELLGAVMWMAEGHYEDGLDTATSLDLTAMFMKPTADDKAVVEDLGEVDWNVVLREANRAVDERVAILREPVGRKREEKLRPLLERWEKQEWAGNLFDSVEASILHPNEEEWAARIKARTELMRTTLTRRNGESTRDYSKRVAAVFSPTENIDTFIRDRGRLEVLERVYTVAFALEKYRLTHEDYPEKLEALAPEVVQAEALVDPYSGESFKYRQDGGRGYWVYSVGPNQKDDGGERNGTTGDDITVKMAGR